MSLIKSYLNFEFDFTQLLNNTKFSSKFIFKYGLNLGGHVRFLDLTTSSILYGVRYFNSILNMSYSFLELSKVLKIIEGIGYGRGVIYVINSIVSLQSVFKSTYKSVNRNFFLPASAKIFNILKNPVIFRYNFNQLFLNYSIKALFFYNLGISLIRKFFISSKWTYGFVSNSKGFYFFTKNVLHEIIKDGKFLDCYEKQVKDFFQIYPHLPQYGVIGDHRTNYWVVNEFTKAWVPNCSAVDTFTNKALYSFYGIPANGCSMDSTFFFLVMALMSYFIGYNKFILKFNIVNFMYKNINFLKLKKNLYFKKFIKYKYKI